MHMQCILLTFMCPGCESIGACMCFLRVSVWVGDLVLSDVCVASCVSVSVSVSVSVCVCACVRELVE